MTLDYINDFLKHKNYYSGDVLINNPGPLEGQLEPTVSFLYDSKDDVEYSVVIPVHNQENIILSNVISVIYNMIGDYEIIIIFDDCTDKSESILISFFEELECSKIGLKRIICIKQSSPIFETSCDNIGFRLAKGNFIVEVQADMKILTFGFNFILSKPFRIYNDVFSVSGRCAHEVSNFNGQLSYGGGIGKMGNLVEKPTVFDFPYMNKFFIMDTCNRGPLVFSNSKIQELGYLDELNFVLGDDDHDINIRAKYTKNYVCGYVPIEFYSPIIHGSTRKEMNARNKDFLNLRYSRRTNPFLLLQQHRPIGLEIRDLDKNLNYR